MRKTNKMMRSGTAMMVLAGLGLSSSVVATAASEPVEQAVKTVLKTVDIQPVPQTPETPTPEIQKLADAEEATLTVAPTTSRVSNLKPMRLRMTPRFTPKQLETIERQRQTVASDKADKNALKALEGTFARQNFLNRFQVTISDDGTGLVEISKGQGGWPGYPITNTGWHKRPLSAHMQKGLKDIMKKCTSASGPIYFNADMLEGDGDIGKGTFEVECLPGSEVNRSNISDLDLAYAYLASDEIPLEKRQGNFQWKYAFATFQAYVKNNPKTTIARDREVCTEIYTTLKRDYGFTERHKSSADHQLQSCATKDYNWIRKRENMSEVQ